MAGTGLLEMIIHGHAICSFEHYPCHLVSPGFVGLVVAGSIRIFELAATCSNGMEVSMAMGTSPSSSSHVPPQERNKGK